MNCPITCYIWFKRSLLLWLTKKMINTYHMDTNKVNIMPEFLPSTFTLPNPSLPYLLSISASIAVVKDFSTNHNKALGLKQAYMYIYKKLRNNYCIVHSVNIYIWIDNRKYITAINKKFIHFFLIWITRMIFD